MDSATRPVVIQIVRNVNSGSYLENVLVSAVVAILALRVFLAITGFPQIGGGGLHISHMLWGGLLMLASLVLMLALLGEKTKGLSAVLGGIGFGVFIDELGKFITSDNNYFFQPTIALIYVIFIGLFLVFRAIARRRELSQRELLANGASIAVEMQVNGANSETVSHALYLLDKSVSLGEFAAGIRQAVLAVPSVEEGPASLLTRCAALAGRTYSRFIASKWFQRIMVTLFLLNAVIFVLIAFTLLFFQDPFELVIDEDPISSTCVLVSSVVSSMLVIVGAFRLPVSRQSAYTWFKRSVLVSIFFTQIFMFYEDQLGAMVSLLSNLVLLSGLNYMLSQERALTEERLVNQMEKEPRQNP